MTKSELNIFIKTEKNSNITRENYIKNHFTDIYNDFITYNFPEEFTFLQKLYHYLNDDIDLKLGICPICGNRTKFLNFSNGYRTYCSNKCSANSIIKQNETKNTCLEKYGCEYVSQSSKIKEKKKQTCIEHFGREYYLQTEEFQQRSKETCLEKYGTEYATQSETVKEKIKTTLNNTCIEKYGTDWYFQTNEFKDKNSETCLEKYGETSFSKTKEFLEKEKQTKLEHYNDENYNNPEKQRQTCLERYNHESYSKTDEFKEKVKKTSLERYGKENYTQTDEYRNKYKDAVFIRKLKQNNVEKFDSDWYFQSEEFKKKFENYEWVKSIQDKIYNTKKKNNSFHTSKIEKQIQQYLDNNNITYIYQYTSERYPFNCDFYFPEKDLYVEIQGSWTHGPRPFTGSIEDNLLLEKWKSKNTEYYQNAIETWTIRDVKKREIARQNELNYLEIFSCDFDTCLKEINLYINKKNN